jgi:hypothetical protein
MASFFWGHDASHYLGLAFLQVLTASYYAMEQALPLIFKSLQALIDECNITGIDLHGTTNHTMITKALREWNKANGENEKSILPQMEHFDEYFEG